MNSERVSNLPSPESPEDIEVMRLHDRVVKKIAAAFDCLPDLHPEQYRKGVKTIVTAVACYEAALNNSLYKGEPLSEAEIVIETATTVRQQCTILQTDYIAKAGNATWDTLVDEAWKALPRDYKDTVTIGTVSDIVSYGNSSPKGKPIMYASPYMIPSQKELQGYGGVIYPIYQFASREEAVLHESVIGSVVEVRRNGTTAYVVYKRIDDGRRQTTPRSYVVVDSAGPLMTDVGRYNNETLARLPSERIEGALGKDEQTDALYDGWQ